MRSIEHILVQTSYARVCDASKRIVRALFLSINVLGGHLGRGDVAKSMSPPVTKSPSRRARARTDERECERLVWEAGLMMQAGA
jgi:hypothetical protein